MSTTPLEAEIADLIRRNIDGHNDQVCLRSDCPDSLPALLAAREAAAAQAVRDQVEAVLAKVESVHQIHGEYCTCGFISAVARDRTAHLLEPVRAALRSGAGS